MLMYGSMQDPGEGKWRHSPIHSGWQVVEVSKFIKSSASKEHMKPYLTSNWQSSTDFSGSWSAPELCLFKWACIQRKYSTIFFHVWNNMREKTTTTKWLHLSLSVTSQWKSKAFIFTPLTYPAGLSLSQHLEKKGPRLRGMLGHWSTQSQGSHFLLH